MEKQLKKQLGLRKKTSLLILLKSTSDFSALAFFPAFLPMKAKKEKKSKTGKKKKRSQIFGVKETKKNPPRQSQNITVNAPTM